MTLKAELPKIYGSGGLGTVLDDVREEVLRAIDKHRGMCSFHDGKAVIEEELDELWDEIKKQKPDPRKLEEEAIQIAAMAVRFVLDLLRTDDGSHA